MEAKPIKIQLLPAPDDGPLENPEYQKAIRDFAESLRARGLKPSTVIRSMDAAAGDAPAIYSGAFQLAKDALPVIGVLVGSILLLLCLLSSFVLNRMEGATWRLRKRWTAGVVTKTSGSPCLSPCSLPA